jgi:hypothetical protein
VWHKENQQEKEELEVKMHIEQKLEKEEEEEEEEGEDTEKQPAVTALPRSATVVRGYDKVISETPMSVVFFEVDKLARDTFAKQK